MTLGIIILAAGKGTRMNSDLPKVLHRLGHKTLLNHVIDAAKYLEPEKIAVVYSDEQVVASANDDTLLWAYQHEQLGTGHAVKTAMPMIKDCDQVMILYGDVPLMSTSLLIRLFHLGRHTDLALVTATLSDPTGYGRIVRCSPSNTIMTIIEERDTCSMTRTINEVNTGIMLVNYQSLSEWLTQLTPNNSQKEYYLTDIIGMAIASGVEIRSCMPDNNVEVLGINTQEQLAQLEATL